MSNTKVKIELHANYAQTAVRFFGLTTRQYAEFAVSGAAFFANLITPMSCADLKQRLITTPEEVTPINKEYLHGFNGHFSLLYSVLNEGDITSFEAEEARYISPVSGGHCVIEAFRNAAFKQRIFTNLVNSVVVKDVDKLNSIMQALKKI